MGALVIAEHNNTTLNVATLNAVAAAAKLGAVDILVAGHQCGSVAAAAAAVAGVGKVLVADAPHYANLLAENVAPLVVGLAAGYSHLLVPATTNGKNIMPRVAALLDVAQLSDIIGVVSDDTFVRPIYAGNVLATVQTVDAIKCITVRTTAFDPVAGSGGNAVVEAIAAGPDAGLSSFKGDELTKSERPELAAAKIVVSGGRGVGSSENFALIEQLADTLGAAVGASRAAVGSGSEAGSKAERLTQASRRIRAHPPFRSTRIPVRGAKTARIGAFVRGSDRRRTVPVPLIDCGKESRRPPTRSASIHPSSVTRT